MHQFTFHKEERLCSKIILERLFVEGKSLFMFPFKVVYMPIDLIDEVPVQVVFSVPKRTFKHAVKRNLLRRRMREAYRLNKSVFLKTSSIQNSSYAVIIIYIDKKEQDYKVIERGMIKVFEQLSKKLI
jgi:ribonuclease P protein component